MKPCAAPCEYIHAGDCFQVNLSQRLLHKEADVHPLELYRRLRERNPAPFAGYFDLGDFVIASARRSASCASRTARSKRGPSKALGRAAPRRKKTAARLTTLCTPQRIEPKTS